MSIHRIKGKNVVDITGNLDKIICENIIEKLIKQCEKIIKQQEKNDKNTEKMCKSIITKLATKIKQEKYREKHNLLVGYLNNEIKPGDKVYLTYDFILQTLKIYSIDWVFLDKVEKVKQKFEHIPKKPGIYILECNQFIYIGETINLHTRLIEHFTGNGSNCTQNNTILNIKHIIPFYNYPNYDKILTKENYEGFKELKRMLLYSEKVSKSIYSLFFPKELINPLK